MNAQPTNKFRALWDLGYRDIIPVVPPGGIIAPNSWIKDPGKAPGVKRSDGLWWGLNGWNTHAATEADVQAWHAMGASAGVRRGGVLTLDIDAYDEPTAAMIEREAIRMLGPAPCRVGQWPKRALIYRSGEPLPNSKVTFAGADGKRSQVETPPQAVFFGVHARTGKPYQWPRPLVPFSDLTEVTAEALRAFMDEMRRVLPDAKQAESGPATDRTAVDQEALKGDPGRVEEAIRALPNTPRQFPHYDDMVLVGQALHAALIDEPQLAHELWVEWASKWEGEGNSADRIEKYWRSFQAPHEIGASYLYDQAAKHGGEAYAQAVAEKWFDPTNCEPLFPPDLPKSFDEPPAAQIRATPYAFPDPAAIPKRETLYAWHYTRQFVSATVAPSKVGKTSLIIAEALAMTSGKPLLGVPVHGGPHRVWLWNGEDPLEEMQRRVAATMLHYGLTREDVGDRLFLDSGRDMEIVLATETRDGARIATPVVEALTRTLLANRIDVMQVDPFVSSHRVSENDNGAIDMVAKRWANIANATRCAVDLVHHVRKLNGGEVTVEDSRGAVALIAASRSARALAKMTKAEANGAGVEEEARRRLFRFADTSANLAPPSGDAGEWMQLVSVGLGNGGGEGMSGVMLGDSVGVVAQWKREEACGATGGSDEEADALERVRAGEWRRDVRAGDAWAGVPIAQAYALNLDDALDKGKAKSILAAMLKRGVLEEVSRYDKNRNMRTYVVERGLDRLSVELFE